MSSNLHQLSDEQKKVILSDRLRHVCSLDGEECRKYTEELFSYYSRVNSFPQTESTLDVSIRVLIQSMKNQHEMERSKAKAAAVAPPQNKQRGSSQFQAFTPFEAPTFKKV